MHQRVSTLAIAATLTTIGGAAAASDLVIYTSTPTEAMDELVAAFNESYPDIEVEYFRSGTTEVINRLSAEFEAGDPQPDILLIADTVVMSDLKADGRLMAYDGAPTAGTDAALHDPDNTFFSTKLITTGFMYNTNLVDTPVTSWADLATPEIAERLTMPSPLYSGAAMIHVGTIAAQDGFGWGYFETLAGHGATAGRGNGGVLEAVAQGQMDYGVIVDFMPLNARAEGSPVDFVFPEEGVTAVTEPVAILETAANVEAAQAFVDWQLSQEGQRFHVSQGYLPILDGIEAPEVFPDMADLQVITADPAMLMEQGEQIKRRFSDLFGG